MARTRGGSIAQPVALPRVYMQANGVKVRKMEGGYRYQPPSLKCLTNLYLDKIRPNSSPNINLYQSVQRVIEGLIDQVKDKILGLDVSGIHMYFQVVFQLVTSCI